jgi:ribosomal protein S18 acetylase RimI-like enzyme
MMMGLTYFKRYRMEIDLDGRDLAWPALAPGYHALAWDPALLDSHSQAKYLSFRDEIDANVFPCFSEFAGCKRLMTDITRKAGFLPQATWLVSYQGNGHNDGRDGTNHSRGECCGTIQGIKDRSGIGAIQNLGITPPHRGKGLGTFLLFRSLAGFREAGLTRVFLEVTADNEGAIKLYRRLGFRVVKTVFKAAEVSYS